MTTKKAAELRYVKLLSELSPGLLKERTFIPSEAPDVLAVSLSDPPIGIEVTRYFREDSENGRPRQEQEALRDKVARLAREQFEEAGGPPAFVSIHLNPTVALDAQSVRRIASAIARCALKRLPPVGGKVELQPDWPPDPDLPNELVHLTIARLASNTPSWSAGGAGWVGGLHPGELQRVLNTKEPVVSRYRQQAPIIWLLIVAEGRLSSSVQLGEGFDMASYGSNFDRAFFLQALERRIVELRLVL